MSAKAQAGSLRPEGSGELGMGDTGKESRAQCRSFVVSGKAWEERLFRPVVFF
ncbi:Uncharacterised protein [Enterobacter cloacae]|nr:Uncharacterised protein [Enterobacter cloacae]